MKSVTPWILLLVAVVVIIALIMAGSAQAPTNESTEERAETEAPRSSVPSNRDTDGVRLVRYTSSGFSPFLVEVTQGEAVRFVNDSSKAMWVTAQGHPTAGDQDYEAFDSGRSLSQGEAFTFTFTRVGNWGYGNRNDRGDLGAIVVQPQ